MRKREHFIGLWLDDTEYKHLLKQCDLSGLNASALIRHSIMGVNIQPKPPDTYAALLRELSAIGNNVNQIDIPHTAKPHSWVEIGGTQKKDGPAACWRHKRPWKSRPQKIWFSRHGFLRPKAGKYLAFHRVA